MSKPGFDPTPLMRLYTDEHGNTIYIKREDLLPFSFGGNKARIAWEYMEDLFATGCDHLVAYGNARSNLCRVLSNLCKSLGIPMTILSPADDDGQRREAYNERLSLAFGARIVPCLKTNVAQAVDQVLAELAAAGRKPYYIYGDRTGCGNEATPTAAYASVYPEILAQEAALGLRFDAVFLATGTGMTQAGLLCGRAVSGEQRRVIGISVARDKETTCGYIWRYANAYLGREQLDISVTEPDIEVLDEFRQSYGVYGQEVAAGIREAMSLYGVPLDGTYTGKAFYGMRETIRREGLQNQALLFIHTGGTPLFFDSIPTIFA